MDAEFPRARTCYDHFAGAMAVRLTAAWERQGWLRVQGARAYELTAAGEEFFRGWGLDLQRLRAQRRGFALRCLDGTEQRTHLAGALGAAVCARLFERGWIVRRPGSRGVRVTAAGRLRLQRLCERTGSQLRIG
ncbi:MAG: hypothetical protein ACRD04_04710 [Terriglobales bacterium]